jgi:hypothetical protein
MVTLEHEAVENFGDAVADGDGIESFTRDVSCRSAIPAPARFRRAPEFLGPASV